MSFPATISRLSRLLVPFLLALGAAATLAEDGGLDTATEAAIDSALAGEHRSDRNKARDKYRRPKETLAFFGLRSDMTVVEIWPGGGWYTEVLAPVLRDDGKLIAAQYSVNPMVPWDGYVRNTVGGFLTKMGGNAAIYDKVVITSMDYPNEAVIAPAGSADMVLTFRNAHNWVDPTYGGDAAAAQTFTAIYNALKPGGVLGVVDHRWPDPENEDPGAANGYMSEDRVIALAEAAGLRFEARSDINRNSKDTHVHPQGVWTLPPSLDGDPENHDHYRAIGESDRMTLRFRKPN